MLKSFKNKRVETTVTGSNKSHTRTYTFLEWKSNEFSDNAIKPFIEINNIIACPGLNYDGFKSILKFRGHCLKLK